MLIRPGFQDIRVIGFYLGRLITILATLMAIPFFVGLFFKEFNPALDYLIAGSLSGSIGILLQLLCRTKQDLNWMHGMSVVALSWIVATLVAAIPLVMSGHYGSYLDAVFEAMSAYTTSGLTLAQNLDHMAMAHNMWRHFIMFLGGQGIVVIGLSLLLPAASGSFRLYVSEGRDEKILPNVLNTARFIWKVSIFFLLFFTFIMTIVLCFEGMPLVRAFFHGMWLFMAGFDTGGFGPQGMNVLYYHSLGLEFVLVFVMILGAFNFNLHYAVWQITKRELWRNAELVTLFITISLTFLLVCLGLWKVHLYPSVLNMMRKGFFHLVSAHTGTGFQTVYAPHLLNDWGHLALIGLIIAMAIGGSMCSTTGAIKTLRISVIWKALKQDVRRVLLPESTVVTEDVHHLRNIFITDKLARSALTITLLYILLYFFGAVVGLYYGYPFLNATFESVSAAANVGLTVGITGPAMPAMLKIVYVFQMWAGRLEFMSVFALFAFMWSWVRGK